MRRAESREVRPIRIRHFTAAAPLFWGARNDVYLAICFGEIRHDVGGLDDSVRDASYQKA